LPHRICSGFDLLALPGLQTCFRPPFRSLHPRLSFSSGFAFSNFAGAADLGGVIAIVFGRHRLGLWRG
jgi:hypothetical protein